MMARQRSRHAFKERNEQAERCESILKFRAVTGFRGCSVRHRGECLAGNGCEVALHLDRVICHQMKGNW